jgi:gliding motility-associated-like protein
MSGGVCNGTFDMQLTIVAAPSVAVTDANICSGVSTITFDAGNSGTGASYIWSDANGPIPGATNQTFTPTDQVTSGTQNYSVQVTIGSCTATDNVSLIINPSPTVSVADNAICETDPAVTLMASGGATGDTYLWSTGATTDQINVSIGGNYTVTVTSTNGCTATDVATLSVEMLLSAPLVNCGSGNADFKYIYTWNEIPGNDGYEISEDNGVTWIPANPASIGQLNSHATNNLVPNFMVHALNAPGSLCTVGRASEPVACAPTLPNIITPNGDGKNDTFIINNIEFYPNNTVKVFNRWGTEVYTQAKYNNATNVFKGDDLPEGTYFIILELGDGRDGLSGSFTISK